MTTGKDCHADSDENGEARQADPGVWEAEGLALLGCHNAATTDDGVEIAIGLEVWIFKQLLLVVADYKSSDETENAADSQDSWYEFFKAAQWC